jgi:YD repeat-containing protein
VSQDAAGNVVITNAKGSVLLVIGGVLMYETDAQGQMVPNAAISQAVQVTLSGNGSNFTITYTPDQTWLSDPHRHFPVAIDPTSTWQGNDHYTNTTDGNIYGDTIDESGNPTSLYYNLNTLRIGNANVDSGLCCNGTSRSYLKFPINPPPTNVRVTSADLAIYQASQYSGGGVQINANAILTAWNETTLDWNNHPTSFAYAGTGTTAATQNNWVHINVTAAAQVWWDGTVALNGFELQYQNETKPQELFYSDDNGNPNHPLLTINYVQDTTAPGGGLAFNGGASAGTSNVVTVAPAGSDAGALESWSSNWTTVNGVGTNGGFTATANSADGTELNANTSSCGSTSCWAQTYFTNSLNINNWPTFTAMFKTDTVANFHFGAISNDNENTRFDLSTSTSSTAFTYLEYSTSAGANNLYAITIPISANTWYYGQVLFPQPNVGEIFIWPVGQLRPATPSVYYTGIYMTNPGLNFWAYGNNGASEIHYSVGNVNMTSKDTSSGTTGYGIYGMQVSSDGTTYGCPPYGGRSSFSGGPWCVYSTQSFPWTFPAGDGVKKLWYKYVDNTGTITSGFSQFIVDTQAPTVNTITLANGNPAQGSEVRGLVTLAVNATDPPASDGSDAGVSSAILYVDGVPAGTGVTGTTTPTFYLDTTYLSPGVHVLTAKATDGAGNTGAIGGSTQIIVSNTALMPYETLAKRTMPDGQTDVSVNVANGDAVVTHPDLDIPGRGPDLALGRTYHSLGGLNGLFGYGWTSDLDEGLTINGDGSVTYRDADGGIHVFLPNGSGGYLTSPGLYLTLGKNGGGTYTLTARDQSKTNFSATGLLTSFVDRNGNTLTVTWNGTMPTTVTDASGRQLTITTSGGHVTQISDPNARLFLYGYDGSGNLTSSTDPSGVVMQYGYDSSHRLTSITLNYVSGGAQDQQTNVDTTLTYDTNSADLAYNRLTGLTDPLGYQVNISYSIPTGGTAFQTQVAQQQGVSPVTYETTTYLLTTDGMGAVARLTDALGNATQYQYDANENVTQVTDPDGHVTTSTYDSNGNELAHVVDPGSSPHLNLTTSWTYDSANNVLTATDPRGIVTQYTYDSPTTGNLIKTVRDYVNNGPTNSDTNVTTTSTYDSYGEVLTTTDPLGIVTTYTYDTQGDVLTTTTNYVANEWANRQPDQCDHQRDL